MFDYINELSSCIDLFFSSDVNLTKNCGVNQSLYKTCYHNIPYRTQNFNILLSSSYFRVNCKCKNATIGFISKSIVKTSVV